MLGEVPQDRGRLRRAIICRARGALRPPHLPQVLHRRTKRRNVRLLLSPPTRRRRIHGGCQPSGMLYYTIFTLFLYFLENIL